MIASCGFLEDELRQCSKEEGVTMADSVETLGVDLRARVKRLRGQAKARRRKCNVRFWFIQNKKAFHKNYLKVGVRELLRTGMVPARARGSACSGDGPYRIIKIEEAHGSSSG